MSRMIPNRIMIEASQLTKNFRIYSKSPGILGSLKSFVRREYRLTQAVSDFELKIEAGEFVGLLGPNGAGKTTLMKMFTGIIVPSTGTLRVAGFTPSRREIAFRQNIALVMGQKSQLWWDIPAMDSLILLQRYYDIADAKFRQRVGELSELLGVKDQLQVHVRKLSLGERMKMELMASLLHDPKVIFLDEPTIGLDVVAQKNIRHFLLEYQRKNGTTIILTSHYMADVAALCSRIVLILGGRKHFDGPIREFEGILGNEKSLSLRFSQVVDRQDPVWTALDPQWSEDQLGVELRIPEAKLRETAASILNRFPVVDLSSEKIPIERVMETLLTRAQAQSRQ
jgi:ABC-2 type transport system ATP-binding protein